MSTLERAIALAATVHAGQRDQASALHVLHPLRMMLKMRTLETQLAAVPHDVVKDCGVILNLLAYEGFPTAVIDSVNAVTKRTVDGAEEPSEDCIRRAALTRISRAVTLADLEDNIDLSRIERPTKKGDARIDRYKRATKLMEKAVRSAGTRM